MQIENTDSYYIKIISSFNDSNDLRKLKNETYTYIKKENYSREQFDDLIETYWVKIPEDDRKMAVEELEQRLDPFFALAFFRGKDKQEQKNILKSTYDSYMVSQDLLSDGFDDVSKIEFKSLQKLFNTTHRMIIIENRSEEATVNGIMDLFGFDKEISIFLYSLFIKNKEELRSLFLLRKIYDIDYRVNTLLKIFESIVNDNENKQTGE